MRPKRANLVRQTSTSIGSSELALTGTVAPYRRFADAFNGKWRTSFNTGPVAADAFRTNANNVNAQTGTAYTLLAKDNGKTITLSNASAISLTVPSGLPAGFSCFIVQLGAGQVTIVASGTTLRSRVGLTTGGQYAQGGIIYIGANTYSVGGDLTT